MNQPYTAVHGWMGAPVSGVVHTSHPFIAGADVYIKPNALVVTGDLDAAERRLAPIDDAAIERAARALAAADGFDLEHNVEVTPDFRAGYVKRARVALAAAEETTGLRRLRDEPGRVRRRVLARLNNDKEPTDAHE